MADRCDSAARFDVLVLSGGGAKGAYGAGAAKAFYAYQELNAEKEKTTLKPNLCFVGTSVGALNAAVLAAWGPGRLVDLWKSATARKVLGCAFASPLAQTILKFVNPAEWLRSVCRFFRRGPPYSLYGNRALRKLINEELVALDFDEFAGRAHLIVCATDYTQGQLAGFYVSALVDRFKEEEDSNKPVAERKFAHLVKIRDKSMLVDALLASAAIPVAFPPVTIERHRYVDGGVGNNTPTREAASFLRYVEDYPELSQAAAGEVFCVLQDPLATVELHHSAGLFEIAQRTYDVFQDVHMLPIIHAWDRINREVQDWRGRIDGFREFLEGLPLDPAVRTKIEEEVETRFGSMGRRLPLLHLPFRQVRPNQSLGSVLDFDRGRVLELIRWGHTDMVTMLQTSGLIQPPEALLLSSWTP